MKTIKTLRDMDSYMYIYKYGEYNKDYEKNSFKWITFWWKII